MLQTQYISLDEFEEYFGINLRLQLGSEENAIAFIKRVEDRVQRYIDSNFNKNVEIIFETFTDYQKKNYKLALLEECIYIYKNSDLFVDSGYDMERGIIVDDNKLDKLSMSRETLKALRLCGLTSRNIFGARWFWWI